MAIKNNLPPPYSTIELLPFRCWSWHLHAALLSYFITYHSVQVIIEVGCWLGVSTLFMASHLPEGGKLYAVDHWLGSEEHQQRTCIPYLYEQFLSNVIHANLTEEIIPIRLPSLEAANSLPVKVDMIYLDASHQEEDVLADLKAWMPRLKPGGILCGDDWNWPAVRRAVLNFACEKGLAIDPIGNFWRLYHPLC